MSERKDLEGFPGEKINSKVYATGSEGSEDGSYDDILHKQLEEENDHEIRYRTCSWQKVSKAVY